MRPATAMDPFDGFDDPIGIGGSDVFGHALNDFDIWGDDDDFHPRSNSSMTKDFPGDDFTVGTEPMSSSDRSSRTYSPKSVQRRSSRTLDAKSRTTMRPKTTPILPISSTESAEESAGQKQQQWQGHDESGVDKSNSIDTPSDDKCHTRTPSVRRNSGVPRRQSRSKLGRETSMRELVALLDSSDANLDSKDLFLEEEKKEVDQKIGPVVSKSIHHNRSIRTKSKSIRHLSDQTNDPRFGGDSKTMDVKPENDVDKSERSDSLEDELKKASSRLRDTSRPQLSRSNSANRKTRDELRSFSSRHLTNSRPSLSMNGTSAARPRRASSMMPAVLTDSTASSSTCETKSDEQEHSITTTKREPPRRNLTRSTSFGRRKPPSRNSSLSVSINSSLGDSNPRVSLSDDEVLEDLQLNSPNQEHVVATTRREPSRRNLVRSTSFGRRKPLERNATRSLDGPLGGSSPRLSLSDDEVLQDSQFNLPKEGHLVSTTKRESSRRNLVRSNSTARRKPPSRNASLSMDSPLGGSSPRLSLSDDELLQDSQFNLTKQERATTKREPSRRNLVRSNSIGRRKSPSRKGSLSMDSPLGGSSPRLSLSDDELLQDSQFNLTKQERATTKREPSRRNLVRSNSFARRNAPSRNASLSVSIASSVGDTNPRTSLSDDEGLEDSQCIIPKTEPSRGNLRQSISGRRKAPLTHTSHHGLS